MSPLNPEWKLVSDVFIEDLRIWGEPFGPSNELLLRM